MRWNQEQSHQECSLLLNPEEFGTGTTTVTSTLGAETEVLFTTSSDYHVITTSAQDLAKWTLSQKLPLARILCHKIVDYISERGMPELCESMAEIYDCDRKRAQYQRQALPSRQSVPANQGKSYQRPGFHIIAED